MDPISRSSAQCVARNAAHIPSLTADARLPSPTAEEKEASVVDIEPNNSIVQRRAPLLHMILV
jgi:hypothetical protein